MEKINEYRNARTYMRARARVCVCVYVCMCLCVCVCVCTWRILDLAGSQLSTELPAHVPNRLKHTLPFSYRLLRESVRDKEIERARARKSMLSQRRRASTERERGAREKEERGRREMDRREGRQRGE